MLQGFLLSLLLVVTHLSNGLYNVALYPNSTHMPLKQPNTLLLTLLKSTKFNKCMEYLCFKRSSSSLNRGAAAQLNTYISCVDRRLLRPLLRAEDADAADAAGSKMRARRSSLPTSSAVRAPPTSLPPPPRAFLTTHTLAVMHVVHCRLVLAAANEHAHTHTRAPHPRTHTYTPHTHTHPASLTHTPCLSPSNPPSHPPSPPSSLPLS
jgi:hypothetical protein